MIILTASATATVSISKPQIVEACATVGLGLAQRPAVPVLGGVLVQTTGTDATLSSFSYDRFVTVGLPGTAAGPDTRTVVDHAELGKLVAALTKGVAARTAATLPVELELGDEATLAVNGYTMPVQTYLTADYPTIPGQAPTVAVVDGAEFVELVGRVATVAGTDDTLPQFTVVHLTVGQGAFTMTATDRFRLAHASMPARYGATVSIALEAAFLRAAVKRLGTGPLTIGRDAATGWVTLRCGTVLLGAREYDVRPIPAVATDAVTVSVVADRAALLAEAQRAMAVAKVKGDDNAQRVDVIVDDDAVRIAPAITGTVAVPSVPATVTRVGGDERTFRYQGRYLVDALGNFGYDTYRDEPPGRHAAGDHHRDGRRLDRTGRLPPPDHAAAASGEIAGFRNASRPALMSGPACLIKLPKES